MLGVAHSLTFSSGPVHLLASLNRTGYRSPGLRKRTVGSAAIRATADRFGLSVSVSRLDLHRIALERIGS